MAYIAQLPAFEIEKRRLCIRLSSSHATAWATATQLLIYFEALKRHLKSFVRVAVYKTTLEIFGRLLMLPLLRQKGYYYTPHMSGFKDETAVDPS